MSDPNSLRIDLNVDIGEGHPYDAELITVATSANVGCGEHAGSYDLTAETVAACRRERVRVGAHPGYPDRAAMGRAVLDVNDPIAVRRAYDSLLSQMRRFNGLIRPAYVKPHGAFYHASQVPGPAQAMLRDVLSQFHVPLLGRWQSGHEDVAREAGVPFLREAYADRGYRPNGTLIDRREPGAVLSDLDQIGEQVVRLAPYVDSICVHGDTPGCVGIARHVRQTLEAAGYEVGT